MTRYIKTVCFMGALTALAGCSAQNETNDAQQSEPFAGFEFISTAHAQEAQGCVQTGCSVGVCDYNTGRCVECRSGSDCMSSNAPICSNNRCIPCSAEHSCYSGFCDTRTGQCVECINDSDCGSRERGVCVSKMCMACSASNCSFTCNDITGKCEQIVVQPEPEPCIHCTGPIWRPPHHGTVIILPTVLNANETEPEITSYNVNAQVNGMYAVVSTEFTISNSNDRALEGELQFPLPDDAVVSGYAININGMMVEASVVEKKKARIAFENEVKKGIDPGLVEQIKGNVYRTRIYPIPEKGSRRVRVVYTTPLAIAPNGDAALPLPMPKKKLKSRDISISVASNMPQPVIGGLGNAQFASARSQWVVDSHETDVTPNEDILVSMPQLPDVLTSIEKNGDDIFFAASVKVGNGSAQSIAMPSSWRIIWDASGSRAPNDIEQAMTLIKQLPESAKYELHVFRNTLEPVQTFKTRSQLVAFLSGLAYDGGTNFQVLEKLVDQKFAGQTLFFTDGMDTMAGALPEFGAKSTAIVSGAARDISTMRKICGGRAYNMSIMTGKQALQQILKPSPVVSAFRSNAVQNVEGIGMPANGRVTVLGRINNEKAKAVLELSNGRSITLDFASSSLTSGNTIGTAWATRRIDALSPRPSENREELLALGRRFGVVSPVSSMIVLETLNQFMEYNIEPPASRADIYREWSRMRPSEANIQAREREEQNRWMTKLAAEWKGRVTWWNNPIPLKWEKDIAPARDNNRAVITLLRPGSRDESSADFESAAVPSELAEDSMSERSVESIGGGSNGSNSASRGSSSDDSDDGEPRSAAMTKGGGGSSARKSVSAYSGASGEAETVDARVTVKAWDPSTPYLQAIKDAESIYKLPDSAYKEYLKQRAQYASSPAFFFDCANYFLNKKQTDLAIRILSNLSEISINDVSLLRIYAWRLRENGDYDNAIMILKKVSDLRPDENVSWRDLALTYTMRAKKNHSAQDAELALSYYHRAAFKSSKRFDAIYTAVVALEEFNELAAWCKRENWSDEAPIIPTIDPRFSDILDTDLRIAMMWDADNTDIDLHVVEPSGEEVYYKHKRSMTGGMISYDVTTGYGPEEILYKIAPKGQYTVKTKYFSSHQQSLVGPATITVMYYTNWGRKNQESHIMSLRLDKQKDVVVVGNIEVK